MTVRALQAIGIKVLKVVPIGGGRIDSSTRSNPLILAEMLAGEPVFEVGGLGRTAMRYEVLKAREK